MSTEIGVEQNSDAGVVMWRRMVYFYFTRVHYCISHVLTAAGSMCEELWAEIPPRAGKIQVPQRTDQNDFPQGELLYRSWHKS